MPVNFITTPNKLKEDKGKIKNSLKSLKAIQFINTHLEEAVDVYAKYTQTDVSNQLNKDTIIATTKCFTNDLSMSPEFYDDLQLWLKENGKIETTIDAKEYFNNHLLFNRTSK